MSGTPRPSGSPTRNPSSRPSSSSSSRLRGPLLVLERNRREGPLRIRLRPLRVALLGLVVLGAGLLMGWGFFFFRNGKEEGGMAKENAGLREAILSLTSRLAALEKPESAMPEGDRKGLPEVRVVVIQGEGRLVFRGKELVLDDGNRIQAVGSSMRVERQGQELSWGQGRAFPEGGILREVSGAALQVGEVAVPFGLALVPQGEAGILGVATMDVERYVEGVLAGEIPRGWEREALKAQAVASRSYALWRSRSASGAYDLQSTVADQVFTLAAPDSESIAATRQTRGEVMMNGGVVAPTYFHSACGGHTEEAKAVWPDRPESGFHGVTCDYCSGSPAIQWSEWVSSADLMQALPGTGGIQGLQVGQRTSTSRLASLRVERDGGEITLAAEDFRRRLGYSRIKSTFFTFVPQGAGWLLQGRGRGHGVGLCQWGSRGLAQEGRTYLQILEHYYPGLSLRRSYR